MVGNLPVDWYRRLRLNRVLPARDKQLRQIHGAGIIIVECRRCHIQHPSDAFSEIPQARYASRAARDVSLSKAATSQILSSATFLSYHDLDLHRDVMCTAMLAICCSEDVFCETGNANGMAPLRG